MKALVGLKHRVKGFLDLDVVDADDVANWLETTAAFLRCCDGYQWDDGEYVVIGDLSPFVFYPTFTSPALARICGE